jgi:hypothetical protein
MPTESHHTTVACDTLPLECSDALSALPMTAWDRLLRLSDVRGRSGREVWVGRVSSVTGDGTAELAAWLAGHVR